MRTKAIYFKACCTSSKGNNCNHLCFGRLKVRQMNGKAFIVEKEEGFRCTLIGGYWHREAGGGLNGSRAFYVMVSVHV